MVFEVLRRADDRRALVGGDSYGDHVAFDELAKMDAGIEMAGHEIEAHLVGRRDIEDDIGVCMRECSERRREHHRRRERRDDETYATRRPFSKPRDLPERFSDVCQRRIKASDELLAGVGRRDAPRRPRQ